MQWLRVIMGCVLIASTVVSTHVRATIDWNGFASIRGTSVSTETGAEPFPGFTTDEFSFKTESLFALQARAYLGDKLSATVQLYAEGSDDFDVSAKWAYVTYRFTNQHQLSAGKLVNPLFQHSTYEKVGLSHDFARLPKAVYLGFDFNTIEGLEFSSQYDLGNYTLITKFLYGSWDGETYSAPIDRFIPIGFKDVKGVNGFFFADWWSVSTGYISTRAKAEIVDREFMIPLMTPAINAALASGAAQDDVERFIAAVTDDGKRAEYAFFALSIDRNNWLFDYERVDYGVQGSLNPQNRAWYASIGKRVGSYTLRIHREDYRRRQNDYRTLSHVEHPILQDAGRTVKDLFTSRAFDGYGITLRWDFHPQAALKIDHFSGKDTRESIGKYKINSIGIDLIF